VSMFISSDMFKFIAYINHLAPRDFPVQICT
jgi:hypothetical protein